MQIRRKYLTDSFVFTLQVNGEEHSIFSNRGRGRKTSSINDHTDHSWFMDLTGFECDFDLTSVASTYYSHTSSSLLTLSKHCSRYALRVAFNSTGVWKCDSLGSKGGGDIDMWARWLNIIEWKQWPASEWQTHKHRRAQRSSIFRRPTLHTMQLSMIANLTSNGDAAQIENGKIAGAKPATYLKQPQSGVWDIWLQSVRNH